MTMETTKMLRIPSPVGELWLCVSERGLCGLGFDSTPDAATVQRWQRHGLAEPVLESTALLERAAAQLADYFARQRRDFDVPLDLRGTPFQVAVWEALRTIPYGDATTYGKLAARLERPGAARAVGRAVGANPVAIILPCHRVLGQGDALTGYGGGLHRKVALLSLEAIRQT